VEPLVAAIAAVRKGLAADSVVYIDRADLPESLHTSEPFVGSGADLPFEWARGYASAAVVLVRGDNLVRGALCVLSHREDAYWASELTFLRSAANLLSTDLGRIEARVTP
jgi:hypothetical protein